MQVGLSILIMMTSYIAPVSACIHMARALIAPLSELVLTAANSAPVLHTIDAVRVTVCAATTYDTFIFYFPWRRHQVEGTNGF